MSPGHRAPLGADLDGLPNRHGFLAQAVANAFQLLDIGATLLDGAGQWHAIHTTPSSVVSFELGHGMGTERAAYNGRCIERVRREGTTVLAQHGGLSDFFVPVATDDGVQAVLITGPFATARPTSADVLGRWLWLTGRHAHLSDSEFAHYLSTALGTLLLEGDQLRRYERWLQCFASLIAARGDARALATEAAALASRLEESRFVDKMWEAARTMVDERTAGSWMSPQKSDDLLRLGTRRVPEHALVGLFASRRDDPEPVAELLQRDAFQRACVDVALDAESVTGRVGDHGVMFLVGGATSAARLVHLGERATALARRHFGLGLHVGTSALEGSGPLGERYEQALGAAERALSRGLSMVRAEPGIRPAASPVRALRRDLGTFNEAHPETLSSTFERYVEAVVVHCGYRVELARAHLEAGFDQAARAVVATGALSESDYLELCDGIERAQRDAVTLADLSTVYRRAVADLLDTAKRPVQAARDRSLRRAIAFIHQHVGEPIRLPRVAHVAGFSPNYFSQLFQRRERQTFERYVRHLRIERAKDLLATTDLSAERVGRLSGFPLRHYFHRVFKQLVGMTPAAYRRSRPVSRHAGTRRA